MAQSLVISKVSKKYDNGVKALDNLSLELGTGMFGLLGPNGAGKSSLMRTIATLQRPDCGSIVFEGIDVLKDPMSLRKKLGYLPQEFGVYPQMSAEDLLDYFALLKGVTGKAERTRLIGELLHLTNLYAARKKNVAEYSGGMKQRFGIAQMLLNKPRLIIVDEPTAGLDPGERNHFLNVLRAVGTQNTVIFSTHIVEDLPGLCDTLAIMNEGRILKQTTPGDATRELAGQIWVKTLAQDQLAAIKALYLVLSVQYQSAQSLAVRVFAKAKPEPGFESAEPVLEDAYFLALQTDRQQRQLAASHANPFYKLKVS